MGELALCSSGSAELNLLALDLSGSVELDFPLEVSGSAELELALEVSGSRSLALD